MPPLHPLAVILTLTADLGARSAGSAEEQRLARPRTSRPSAPGPPTRGAEQGLLSRATASRTTPPSSMRMGEAEEKASAPRRGARDVPALPARGARRRGSRRPRAASRTSAGRPPPTTPPPAEQPTSPFALGAGAHAADRAARGRRRLRARALHATDDADLGMEPLQRHGDVLRGGRERPAAGHGRLLRRPSTASRRRRPAVCRATATRRRKCCPWRTRPSAETIRSPRSPTRKSDARTTPRLALPSRSRAPP